MSFKKLGNLLVVVFIVNVIGCSKNLPIGDYDSAEVGKVKKVASGVIVSMRPVRLHNTKNAEEGHLQSERETTFQSNPLNKSRGFEFVIKLDNGNIISVVQAEDTILKVKQRILVIRGKNTRIVPDNGSNNL